MKTLVILAGFIGSLAAQSTYFQQDVSYDIDVRLDDSSHTLDGHIKISYTNNSSDTLDFLWFHLWPNAYKNDNSAYAKQALEQKKSRFHFSKEDSRGYIDSLDFTVDGDRVRWEFHPEWIDVAKILLNTPLPPQERIKVSTPFFVKIPEVFSRLGHTGKHYEMTQWYPKPAVYDVNGWHPMPYLNQGEFYSEFGTFDVRLTVPEHYIVLATGDLVNGEKELKWLDSLAVAGDSLHALGTSDYRKAIRKLKKRKFTSGDDPVQLKTLHFHQENVHDFAWFADPRWIVRKGELYLADSTRKITLWSAYLPKNAKLWERSIEYLHDSGYWYSRFLGDYPYNHITAVDGDLSAGGGMEYPNITVISSGGSKDLLELVIMHEVGHNWFYGILGTNERRFTWMDEGLNEWINHRYWEHKYGDREGAMFVLSDMLQNKLKIGQNLSYRWANYIMYQTRSISGDEQPLSLSAGKFYPANYGAMNYAKTGIFSYHLGKYLNDEQSDAILNDYFSTWKFKHPYPEDFESIVKRHTDKNLDWYFEQMFTGESYIDYEASHSKGTCTVKNNGDLAAPFQVGFYDRNDVEISRRWIDGFKGETVIDCPENTGRLIIDPDNIMPDIDRTNNASRKKFLVRFGADAPRYYEREIFIAPWLFNWNVYNGLAPGVLLYTGFVPGYSHGLSLRPQWDLQNGQLIGKMKIQHSAYRIGPFRKMTVSSSISKYEGRSGIGLNLTGLIRRPVVNTPQTTLKANLFYHDLDSLALNPDLYTSGSFVTGKAGINYSHRPSYFLSYSGEYKTTFGVSDASFIKMEISGHGRYRWNRKINTGIRFWAGGFLIDTDLPQQYSIFMNGGVDPDFEMMVLDRTDSGGKGFYNVNYEQYLEDGPGVHGQIPDPPSKEFAWGLNLKQSLPGPVSLYLDCAGATDKKGIYASTGLMLGSNFIKIYIPLYQSWDRVNTPADLSWMRDRLQFEISLDGFISI